MQRMKILIFAGSTRAHSLNRQLARATARLAQEAGGTPTILELGDLNLPMYSGDTEDNGMPPGVLQLKALMLEHPAWLICSPEYNGSYTPVLKNAIDWASRPIANTPEWADGLRAYRGKVVGLLAASPGGLGGMRGLAQLAPLLMNLQCWVTPRTHALGNAHHLLTADGHIADATQEEKVRTVVRHTLWAAQQLQAGGPSA
jgi:chromate reductase